MAQFTAYDAERLLRRNAFGAGALAVVAVIMGLLLFFLHADFTWSMFVMIGFILLVFIGISMSYAPKATLLSLIFLKPMVDQLWWFRAFGGMNFQALMGALVPVVAFVFLFLTRNQFFLRAPMCVWVRRLCILTGVMLLFQHFIGNEVRMGSVAEEFRIISGPALFFLTGWLFTEAEDMKRLGKAVIWSSVWIFIGIVVAYAIGKERFSFEHFGTNPLEGMYYHKHDLARVCTMICVFSLCFVKMTESTTAKYACYAIAAAMIVIVFSSYTRMSWIAIFLCVCFWYIWIGKWKQVLLIAPIVVVLSWGTLDEAFRKAHFDMANPDITDPKSISGRGMIWKAQIVGFMDMNFAEQLLGGGYNRSVGLSYEYSGIGRNAHSCIPLMLVENGIIFTLIYNLLLIKLCLDAWSLRKMDDVRLKLLGALFLVGVAYFYLSGVTTNSHTYPSLTWYVWGLGGIVYRIKNFPVTAGAEEPERQTAHRFFSRSFAPAPLVRPPS